MKKDIYEAHSMPLILAFLSFFWIFPYTSYANGDKPFIARVSVKVDLSISAKGKDARLWLPYPVSDSYQKITHISIRGTCRNPAVYTDQQFKRPVLFASWDRNIETKRLALDFTVQRYERKENRELKGAPAACFDEVFFRKYMQGSRLAPLDEKVRLLAENITGGEEDILIKARLIYNWVTANMRRDPAVKGCGCGNVCLLLDRRSGKCADIHSVFVALLKAAGIPAREVFGLRLSKGGKADITTWQHCWAEFYVPGYGWYVADPGDYLKALLVKRFEPFSKEAREVSNYFFGSVDPYRLRFGVGRDIELNPPARAGEINYLMYPYAEADGIPLDFNDPKTFSYSICQGD